MEIGITKKIYGFLGFLFFAVNAFAAVEHTDKTSNKEFALHEAYKPDSTKQRKGIAKVLYVIKPIINLDSRQSYNFSINHWVANSGLRLGFEMFEKYRFGWGGYNSGRIPLGSEIIDGKLFDKSVEFSYFNTFSDYVFYENYKWELSASGSFGIGTGTVYGSGNSGTFTSTTPTFPITEFLGNCEYKFFPWLGFSTGIGLRQALKNKSSDTENDVRKAFSGPMYAFRIKIHLGPLVKYFVNHKGYKDDKQNYLDYRAKKRAEKHLND